jgi:hypothetical protein
MRKRADSKCMVASQVVMAGTQEIRARSFGQEDGWPAPYLSLRIGRVIFNIEDRDALYSLVELVKQAQQLADETYGPARTIGR